MKLAMFTKPFASLSIEETADVIAGLGFESADLTVRPREHVLPERVETDLPRAQEALARRSLTVAMLTTAITDPADPTAAPIFRTASRCGIKELKLGYWGYKGFGHIREQIADVQQKLAGLQSLAREYGVRASVHLHSGENIAAMAPVVAMLLDGLDPQAIGAYVDPGHMMVEGSLGGWRQGLDLLRDRISIVGVKDFGWREQVEGGTGGGRWSPCLVPLAEGSVPWDEVFAILRDFGFAGIVTLASAYQSSQARNPLSVPQVVEQTRADLAFVRARMQSASVSLDGATAARP